MPRWLQTLLLVLLGLAAGLFYGWRIAPVEYVDLAPNTLRADYRAEYILMVAEAYQTEEDLNLAARCLALLDSAPPDEIIATMLANETVDYTPKEEEWLAKLLKDIRAWEPTLAEGTP